MGTKAFAEQSSLLLRCIKFSCRQLQISASIISTHPKFEITMKENCGKVSRKL